MRTFKAKKVKFEPKAPPVTGWQFYDKDVLIRDFYTNGEKAYIFEGYTVHTDNHGPFIVVSTPQGQVKARWGEWVIQYPDGRKQIIGRNELQLTYREVK